MSETGNTKRRARLEELRAATAEVLRLRRELSEAEARRDALVGELAEAAPALMNVVLPQPKPIVVQSRYMAFLERIRQLKGEISRRQIARATGVRDRSLSEYLKQSIHQGILRRTQPGWFRLRTSDAAE